MILYGESIKRKSTRTTADTVVWTVFSVAGDIGTVGRLGYAFRHDTEREDYVCIEKSRG